MEKTDRMRLGSESDTGPLTSFVDLNWSLLFRYERGTYSIELTAESNDPGIVEVLWKSLYKGLIESLSLSAYNYK